MSSCDNCIHRTICNYFDPSNNHLTDEERFIENCVGCCCGDGYECNRANNKRCSNWEDGTEPLLG